MLLYKLIENCSYRDEFQSNHEQCTNCSYGTCCPRDCQSCLQYVHFPQNAPALRVYIWRIAIIANTHTNMHRK